MGGDQLFGEVAVPVLAGFGAGALLAAFGLGLLGALALLVGFTEVVAASRKLPGQALRPLDGERELVPGQRKLRTQPLRLDLVPARVGLGLLGAVETGLPEVGRLRWARSLQKSDTSASET